MFLCNLTHTNIQFAVHLCVRFSTNKNLVHEKGFKKICKDLKGTLDSGKFLRLDPDKSSFLFMLTSLMIGHRANQMPRPRSS